MKRLSFRAKALVTALIPVLSTMLVWLCGNDLTALSPHALTVLAISMGGVSAVAASVVLSKQVATRLDYLIEASALVSTGLHIRSMDESQDEIGRLAAAFVNMSRQVIERRNELNELTTRLEGILRATTDVSIIAEDMNGLVSLWNPGAEKLLGYRAAETTGRLLTEVVHPDREMRSYPEHKMQLETARRGARMDIPHEHENVYFRKDGMKLEVQLSVTPLKNLKGEVIGLLHVAHDITARKVLETELREKNEQLKQQARQRAEEHERTSQSLLKLKDAVIAPLTTVERTLDTLKQTLQHQQEVQVVARCRTLTETAIDTVRQLGFSGASETVETVVETELPDFLQAPRKAADDKLRAIDDWYEEKGDLPNIHGQQRERDKILVVDDFDGSRALMRTYLQDLNYDLHFAGDGEEALRMIAEQTYRLVLMDIEMPRMDGRATTRKLREWEDEQGRPHMPIIAVTAHADPGDNPGWSAALEKPLTKGKLLREVTRYLNV